MFKRKLMALDYPSPGNFNANNEKEFRAIVLWLEDQKIRHYKIEDREPMRQVTAVGWPAAFKKYQDDLGSPVTNDDLLEQLEWLLGYAVNLEYGDNVDKYQISKDEKPAEKPSNTPKLITANPLDNIDFSSDDFKAGVTSLAKLLNVTCHPDHLVTLAAISKVVTRRLNPAALAAPDTIIVKGVPFPFLEADLGFDTGDYVLNQAAKILRLLYIHDMRDLQTRVNECIVSVQKVTADPKTDTKLGVVGR